MCPRCFRLKHAEFDSLRSPRLLPGRFRDRVWPVFWRPRPRRRARLPLPSPCHAKWDRSMHKAIRLEIARHWDLVDEACQLREPWHR